MKPKIAVATLDPETFALVAVFGGDAHGITLFNDGNAGLHFAYTKKATREYQVLKPKERLPLAGVPEQLWARKGSTAGDVTIRVDWWEG